MKGCNLILTQFLLLNASVSSAFVPSSFSVHKSTSRVAKTTSSRPQPLYDSELPDYGKTSIDVDQHRLEKRKKWQRKDLFGTSLSEQTLQDLEQDEEFQNTVKRLKTIGAAGMTREERLQRRRALDDLGIPEFTDFLETRKIPAITRQTPEVLQINVGLHCNQACAHCHVESSPLRQEMMDAETAARCLEVLKTTPSIHTLDITGGAPELNKSFRLLVEMARKLRPDIDIIDRCNLTVLQEPGQEDLVDFLKRNKVHVIASLPCYSADNVETQRGSGVFDRSIAALLALNDAGYGTNEQLKLDLVYNPLGAFLPPPQQNLEAKYKEVLEENFGILFNALFTMTNMPIKRFADFLHRRQELKEYMDLLVRNFNGDTTKSLMCLNTVSVDFNGKIFDCDFNQQLGYTLGEDKDDIHGPGGVSVFDIDSYDDLSKYAIRTDNHCYGCTAGMGSS